MNAQLPVGIQSFEQIREEGMGYVDKTEGIAKLAGQSGCFFLSRPRRFGKSLLVSTLKCLWQGRRELFEGLWIGEGERWRWQPHPVIVIDFNGLAVDSPENLEKTLRSQLDELAADHQLTLGEDTVPTKFRELIVGLAEQTGRKVVFLVDEYDRAIVHHLGQGDAAMEIARANQKILREFFVVLKDAAVASHLGYAFMTGISRFSKLSVFSAVNQFRDISMSGHYADLIGITEPEIERDLMPYLDAMREETGQSRAELLDQLRAVYNGYRFTAKESLVYNPFSLLSCLANGEIDEYWFDTATPSFLIQLLQQSEIDLTTVDGLEVPEQVFGIYDLDSLDPIALLFQTGYLTIQAKVTDTVFRLGFPNREVRSGFLSRLTTSELQRAGAKNVLPIYKLDHYLETGDLDRFFEVLTGLFSSVPYEQAARLHEANFHALFYLILRMAGVKCESELLTNQGRIDLALESRERVSIFEFKCGQTAAEGLAQIKDKGYAERWQGTEKPVFGIGVGFDVETRNISGWEMEEL